MLVQHAVHGGAADAIRSGDLADGVSAPAILKDRSAVEMERRSADAAAFKAGPAHAGADPLDDQVAFQFRDGADDDDDGAAQWTAGVDLLTERDELDVEPVQFIEHL